MWERSPPHPYYVSFDPPPSQILFPPFFCSLPPPLSLSSFCLPLFSPSCPHAFSFLITLSTPCTYGNTWLSIFESLENFPYRYNASRNSLQYKIPMQAFGFSCMGIGNFMHMSYLKCINGCFDSIIDISHIFHKVTLNDIHYIS